MAEKDVIKLNMNIIKNALKKTTHFQAVIKSQES